jgi:hypothetical protein
MPTTADEHRERGLPTSLSLGASLNLEEKKGGTDHEKQQGGNDFQRPPEGDAANSIVDEVRQPLPDSGGDGDLVAGTERPSHGKVHYPVQFRPD